MIYMLGGAGYLNFGDELMVRCWLDYFRERRPGERVVVDGALKSDLRLAFSDDYPDLGISDAFNFLSERTDIDEFWAAFIRGLTFFSRGGFEHHKDLKADGSQMLDAEIIHMHGGGYVNFHFPRKAFLMGAAIAVSRMQGNKLIGTGLGLMPLNPPTDDQLKAIEGAFEQFSLIETRDQESADFIKSIAPDAKIEVGVDDTFLGDLQYGIDGAKRLHLSWSNHNIDDPELARIEQFAIDRRSHYDEVVFWHCAPNDDHVWSRLSASIPGIEDATFYDLLKSPLPINPGDHMLTARFHPHLVGARGGAVGGFFSPGPYYDVKHGSIEALGSGFFKIADKKITKSQFGRRKNRLYGKVGELRADKLKRADSIFAKQPATVE